MNVTSPQQASPRQPVSPQQSPTKSLQAAASGRTIWHLRANANAAKTPAKAESQPPTLKGTLYKKSPRGPRLLTVYQERSVTVKDGALTYFSGKGELRSVAISDISAVAATNIDMHEFTVTVVAVPAKVPTSSNVRRVYMFRAQTLTSMDYWIKGLQA